SSPIIAECYKFRMTKVVIERPFEELDHRYQLRLQPAASLHVFSGKTFSPASFAALRKISKRTLVDRQAVELSEDCSPQLRNESGVDSGRISEIATFEVSDQDGIEGVRGRYVPANDQ